MKVEVIRGSELTSKITRQWDIVRQSHPNFANPYFSWQFTKTVTGVRRNVFVAVIHDNGKPLGFFPFQRSRLGVGRPVGLAMSDYHGVIIDPEAEWDAKELIKQSGLRCWHYDHLLAVNKPFLPFADRCDISPIIDLTSGYDAYISAFSKQNARQYRDLRRRMRKLVREVGEPEFNDWVMDHGVLKTLMLWKTQQSDSTGTVPYFRIPWIVEMFRRIHGMQSQEFSGRLSSISVGGRILAGVFQLTSSSVWHGWLMAFDREYVRYSPTLHLLHYLIEKAASEKVRYIDLGKGMSRYKQILMNGTIPLTEGCIDVSRITSGLRQFRLRAELLAKQSPFTPILRLPGRYIKRAERQGRYK